MILVSSCLLGFDTKYDNSSNPISLIMKYTYMGKYIPICPEQLGGLPTPRKPAEIFNGSGEDVLINNKRVFTKSGEDYTKQFIKGAEQTLKICNTFPITAAILKERSPSCGSSEIYDGSFRHISKPGQGVTTALLKKNGIRIYSEDEITEDLLIKLLQL